MDILPWLIISGIMVSVITALITVLLAKEFS